MKEKKENSSTLVRWQKNRFGMFIHWGIYALPARHEWVQSREKITPEDYRKYFDNFNPDLYDPAEWASWCRKAGMKYVVLTTKHHDGFCLYDSKYTDWKCTNTPYGKDLLKMFVDAFRAEGIKIGLYHSLLDWHHPEYTLDPRHPMVEDEKFIKEDSGKDISKYAEYLHSQVEEILTNYGKIECLFFDFSTKEKGREAWNSEELVKLCRRLQPEMLINDRLDLKDTDWGWDYVTPEQVMLRKCPEVNARKVPWETCQTFSGSWGYYRDEYTWKSTEQLLKLLVDTVCRGGNLLLNVGPTARGEFDARARERLAEMGEWLRLNGRSVYGCGEAPEDFDTPQDCRLTYNPDSDRLYLHVFSWPAGGELFFEGAGIKKVKYAQLLCDGSETIIVEKRKWQGEWEDYENSIILKVPVKQPSVLPVIEIILE